MTDAAVSRSWMDSFKFLTRLVLVLSAFVVPISTSATAVLFPLAFLLSWFAETPRQKWHFISRNPIALLLLLFFAYYVVSLLYTVAPVHDIAWRMKKAWLLLFAACLMPFFQEERWRRYAINAFLLAMVITLFLSYIKYYADPPFMANRFMEDSVFKDHIIQNFLMAFSAFIFAYRFFHKYRYRWVYAVLALIATHNVFFVNTGRAGYFIYAGLLLYFFMSQYGWKGLSYAVVLSALLFGILFSASPVFRDRLLHLEKNYQSYQQGQAATSLGIRMTSWRNAVTLAEQRPILGYGAGGFKTAYATLSPARTKATGIMPVSYNAYLNVAVELGLVGAALFVFLLAFQWLASFQLVPELRFVIQALLLGYALGSLANPWLSDTTELHLYCLFTALAFAALPSHYRGFLRRRSANDSPFAP